jgi:transposase
MGRKAYTKSQKVQKYLEHNAGAKAPEVAKATGVDISYVYNIVSSSRKLKVGDSATEPKKRGRPTKLFKELMAVARGEQKPRLRMQTAPKHKQHKTYLVLFKVRQVRSIPLWTQARNLRIWLIALAITR